MLASVRPGIIDQPSPEAARITRAESPAQISCYRGPDMVERTLAQHLRRWVTRCRKNRLRAAIRPPATSILRGPTRAVKPCARRDRQLLASSQLLPAHSDVAESCRTAGPTVPSAHQADSTRRGSMWTMTDGSQRRREKLATSCRAGTQRRPGGSSWPAVMRRGQLRARPSATGARDASVRPAPRPRRAS